MLNSRISTAICLTVILLASSFAAAQDPWAGLVFSHRFRQAEHVVFTDEEGLLTLRSGREWIRMGRLLTQHGNRGVVMHQGHAIGDERLVHVSETGTEKTLYRETGLTSPLFHMPISLDQDGQVVFSVWDGSRSKVLKTAYWASGSVSTLAIVPFQQINGLCRDQETGHFVALTHDSNLLEINRANGSVRTLAAVGASRYEGIDVAYLPSEDTFALLQLEIGMRSGGLVRVVERDGSERTRARVPTSHGLPMSLTYDDRRDLVFAGTESGDIACYTSLGFAYSGSRSFGMGAVPGIDVWLDRQVSVTTKGTPEDPVVVNIKFARGAKVYYAAVSHGQRGGPSYLGLQWNITLDSLFFDSFAVWPSFKGSLSGAGAAVAGFRLPDLPTASRIYVTAVAHTGGTISHVGNTECIWIR